MIDWKSPGVMAQNQVSFQNLMHVLFGLYLWEWASSLNFDWQFISGKKQLKWPLIFYWAGRYSLLFSFIGITVALNVKSPIDCQGLYTFNQVFGNGAIGFASINLAIRTMAIWKQKWYIVVGLIIVILGHWSLLVHGILLKAAYIPGVGCAIIETNTRVLSASFIYTMAFDFLVLLLTAYKLMAGIGGVNGVGRGRSRLVNMLFGDGLVYFLIAFLANTVATTFMLMNLNPVMSIIFNVPAAVASTIVASRVVRRLSNFIGRGPETFEGTANVASVAFGKNSRVNSLWTKGGPVDSLSVPMQTLSGPTYVGQKSEASTHHSHRLPFADESRSEFDIEQGAVTLHDDDVNEFKTAHGL